MKILVVTEKPFAKKATDEMRNIAQSAGVELVLLEKYTDVNDFYRAVETVDGLIVRSDKVTKEVVVHAKNLKIVVRAGAGFDNLDLAACTERKIVCINTPGQNSNAVAELGSKGFDGVAGRERHLPLSPPCAAAFPSDPPGSSRPSSRRGRRPGRRQACRG